MNRLCLLLVVISCVNSYVAGQEVSSQAYYDNEVIPDVLSVVPEGYLTVQYPSGAEVEEGNVVTPTQAKDIPTITWDAAPGKFYTVILADPDAPTRASPTSRNWLHWMVGNVRGPDVGSGENLAEYIGSGPSENSGFHRYVFLVYQQPGPLLFDEPRLTDRSAENRASFSINDFVKKYDLGNPFAGNFFQAEYDDYVPILYEQIGL
ncbi:hypothetical protein PYW07_008677 [Mythimna separata]|uniref:Phosphatidylethanolamine-binding protein n=1 Tax=Mythimna separata TaxID=271217 RepID=A0AAD8DN33_MYTSE|nr:hypothetical protein PYW07_008677 [Mythimna separata]